MNIRLATQHDYDRVMLLLNEFVNEDRYSKHDFDSYIKVLGGTNSHLFVAESEGQVIGFASVSVRNVVRYPQPIAELDELIVTFEYRSKGIGKELMSAVETKAREVGCYRLYIESSYKHTNAHTFYEKIGYINYGYHFMKNL